MDLRGLGSRNVWEYGGNYGYEAFRERQTRRLKSSKSQESMSRKQDAVGSFIHSLWSHLAVFPYTPNTYAFLKLSLPSFQRFRRPILQRCGRGRTHRNKSVQENLARRRSGHQTWLRVVESVEHAYLQYGLYDDDLRESESMETSTTVPWRVVRRVCPTSDRLVTTRTTLRRFWKEERKVSGGRC